MATLLSIIICTRNRAEELAGCVRSIVPQAGEFDDVEILVVDNGSTDNTSEVVERISEETGGPIRYVFEPVAGLCQARNRGRAEARGRVLAYLDDDVIIGDEWVRRVRQHFLNGKSDCLGGKVTANLVGEPPFKVDDSMLWFFQATAFGEKPRELVHPEHPIGCNMAFTTDVFDVIGGFDTNLKLYGDETDFFRRASDAGFSTWYDPEAVVDQTIPADRLTKEELKQKSRKWGEGAAVLWLISKPGNLAFVAGILKYVAATATLSLRLIVKPDFPAFYTYWYNLGFLSRLFTGIK